MGAKQEGCWGTQPGCAHGDGGTERWARGGRGTGLGCQATRRCPINKAVVESKITDDSVAYGSLPDEPQSENRSETGTDQRDGSEM